MAGYVRQSTADIIPTATVRAAPINAEYNALRDAFAQSGGHKHDGSSGEGEYVPLIADLDALNKVVVDNINNRVGVFVEVAAATVEQLRIQDGVIVPVTDNDIDLGTTTLEFKNLYLDGIANVDTLTVDENATVAGTLGVSGLATLTSVDINAGAIDNTIIGASTKAAGSFTTITTTGQATLATADINGGTVDGAVIGGSSAQAVTGTLITATTGFAGGLTGNVVGNLTGNVTGNSAGTHTGAVIGNVTAATGSSTFNDMQINGTLNMDSGTVGTITGLSTPVNTTDATTKAYVDAADALKLNLTGGTLSGALAMGTNKITGLGTPTVSTDAATKGYVDTGIAAVIDAAPAALDTLNELAAALGDDANFATTVTNSIATKLPLAGGTMSGAIAMGTSKITGLGNPTLAQDAATKTYVDTADALKLNLAGGTMSGAIAMGTSKITGLGDPTVNQDAATKIYVDTQDALKLSLTGGTLAGNIVMGSNKVTTTADPVANDDLTRKGYIDTLYGSTASAAASAAAAAISETNAGTSATNSSNSASASAASAAAALISEGNASTSASNASTSETNAATSATNAYNSQVAAAASAASAESAALVFAIALG
jgi:fibronectin-binding autotransporter adhesin